MTFYIGPDSPRAARAAAFGRELGKAMHRRGCGTRTLAEATGSGRSAIMAHRQGRILPRHDLAVRYAQALEWPSLIRLSEEARQKTCAAPGCGRTFIDNSGTGTRLYCDTRCQYAAERARTGRERRRTTTKGLIERAAGLQAAVDAMCRECEPDGSCRMEDCPLRPFSPLSLDERRKLPVATAIRR